MVLVFNVTADMAMFRKAYTTTSQVSYPFPPPTAVAGLAAAIAGLEHGAGEDSRNAMYWEELRGTRIGIALKRPVQWFSTSVNLLKFKTSNGQLGEHIQSKHQYLKQPGYTIFISGGAIYAALKHRLERGEFVYTPFLGTAYAIADIEYIGEFQETILTDFPVWIDTIVPDCDDLQVDVIRSGGLQRERVPYKMTPSRELYQTVGVLYAEPEMFSAGQPGPPIWINAGSQLTLSRVHNHQVAWFEPW